MRTVFIRSCMGVCVCQLVDGWNDSCGFHQLPSNRSQQKHLAGASAEQVYLTEFVSNWNMLINNVIRGDTIELFYRIK